MKLSYLLYVVSRRYALRYNNCSLCGCLRLFFDGAKYIGTSFAITNFGCQYCEGQSGYNPKYNAKS